MKPALMKPTIICPNCGRLVEYDRLIFGFKEFKIAEGISHGDVCCEECKPINEEE